jgi:hypothetical protein
MTASAWTVVAGSFVGKGEVFTRVVRRDDADAVMMLARRFVL